jgi:transposase
MNQTKLSDFEKGQIVAFSQSGVSNRLIASKINRSHTSINKFLKSYNNSGNYERKKGSGRKRKTSKVEDTKIISKAKKNIKLSAKKIRQQSGLSSRITVQTIRNRLHEYGFFSTFQIKKPFISDINRSARLKWAKEHVTWTLDQWKRVLWSDESPFVLRYNRKQRIWRLPNDRYNVNIFKGTVNHDKKIMVWGCFSWNGVGDLYRINGIMKAENYKQILIHYMRPSAAKLFQDNNYIFQQDNDPKHTANVIKKYLSNHEIQCLQWLAQSTDLNPIENLWSILDSNLSTRNPSNEAELFQILKDGWKNLSIDTLHNLVESMNRRCQAVIESNGMPTRY